MLAEIQIEELRGIAQVDLVYIVVDGATRGGGVVRNGAAIVRKAGGPAPAPKATKTLHQEDLVHAAGVPDLLDRPHEHSLGPVLAGLGAQEDADRKLPARPVTGSHAQRDEFRSGTLPDPG